jgi:antitoxin component YwqK of YwqJK toxin-antitoxin module
MFYPNGEFFYEGEFINDAPNGERCKTFTPKGGISFLGDIVTGARHGLAQYYHMNGKCARQGSWMVGKPDDNKFGLCYDETGCIVKVNEDKGLNSLRTSFTTSNSGFANSQCCDHISMSTATNIS